MQLFSEELIKTKLAIDVESLVAVDGELHLIVHVKNRSKELIRLSVDEMNEISDSIFVVRSDDSKKWGNYSSTPILKRNEVSGIIIDASKKMLVVLKVPSSSLFSESDFNEKIKFAHQTFILRSPIFEVKRENGDELTIVTTVKN
jgi:hypothetical protein